MAKPVLPVVPPRVGRGEQPDVRDNEIVIELDRENQYSRTQPRANEPQGNARSRPSSSTFAMFTDMKDVIS